MIINKNDDGDNDLSFYALPLSNNTPSFESLQQQQQLRQSRLQQYLQQQLLMQHPLMPDPITLAADQYCNYDPYKSRNQTPLYSYRGLLEWLRYLQHHQQNLKVATSFLEVDRSFLTPWNWKPFETGSDIGSKQYKFTPGSFFAYEVHDQLKQALPLTEDSSSDYNDDSYSDHNDDSYSDHDNDSSSNCNDDSYSSSSDVNDDSSSDCNDSSSSDHNDDSCSDHNDN